MTKRDANTIRRAAIIMLHVVAREAGGNDLKAALKSLPPDPADVEAGRISLRAARELLEDLPAWTTKD